MKSLLYIYLFVFLFIKASALSLDVQSFVFYGEKPYVECYIRVDGASVGVNTHAGASVAEVEFLLLLKKNDQVIHAEKFILKGKVDSIAGDFMDIRRFFAPEGNCSLYILATDKSDENNKSELEQLIQVSRSDTGVFLSDVMLLSVARQDSSDSPFTKNGIYMEPLQLGYAPESQEVLYFYAEVYSADSPNKEELYLQYSITETSAAQLSKKNILNKFKKLNQNPIEPVLLPFSVKEIMSGNYDLSVSIVNKKREVLHEKRVAFVRSNPTADLAFLENYNTDYTHSFVQNIPDEELEYILKAHVPIADQNQMATLDEIIKKGRPKSQKQYLFQYWKRTAGEAPEAAYKQYMEVAKVVDKQFHSNVGYGFQTDRGYIFLKYGRPNNVLTIDNEPDAPPYEIWYYNYITTTRQTNVRFLFWNPSLVHNDFRLLHSNCWSERNNPQWEVELYRSVPMERIGNATDARQVGENWNRHARRYFNDY
jgi:GWxTD domain-containing protein